MPVVPVDPSFEAVLRAAGSRSMTRAEFAGLSLPDALPGDRAWRTMNAVRYSMGEALPFDRATLEGQAAVQESLVRANWYASTERLRRMTTACYVVGTNNPHVATTLMLPEGRHLKAPLVLRECLAALDEFGVSLPFDDFFALAVELVEPQTPQERLAANASQVLRGALDASGASHDYGVGMAAALYARFFEGVDRKVLGVSSSATDDAARAERVLAQLESALAPLDPLLKAVVALLAVIELRPFPLANALLGRILYMRILRANGLAVLAYVPVLEFIRNWRTGALPEVGHHPAVPFSEAVMTYAGTRDWTRYLEELLTFVASETWWFSGKLNRMELRRARLEDLLARDAHYNERQHAVLVEAFVHDDAEFTFADLMECYGVVYSTAYADLAQLEADGMIVAAKNGKRKFFIAAPDIRQRMCAFMRAVDPGLYATYFDGNGKLAGVQVDPLEGFDELRPPTAVVDDYSLERMAPSLDPSRRVALARDLRARFA